MADYGSKVLPTHAIYPSSRLTRYAVLLIVFKFLRVIGLFLSFDILKLVHVVQFLFIVKLGSSLGLVVLQKPFSTGKKLSKNQYFRVARHAFFDSVIHLLWLFGLTLCGPLRTILLYEHADLVVLTAAGAIFSGNGGPSKMRGAVFFLLAFAGLLFFDHDEVHKGGEGHPEGHHSSIITHMFYHIVSWSGMSDHMGGVVLLFVTLCLNVGFNSASKKLSLDIGGAKRLNAMSSLFSCLFLLPWAAFIYFTKDMPADSVYALILPFLFVVLSVFLVDFYVESVCLTHLDIIRCSRITAINMFITGLILSCFWSNPLAAEIQGNKINQLQEHILSGGVIFSLVLFLFATNILTGPNRGSRASFIGYSPTGEPLYSYASHALQRTSHSIYTIAKSGIAKILSDSDSRKIFYFLCINLTFTFVELVYGAWTNSLGLISDGFHMLFDCSALVMGLYAAIMSKWKATRIFSYGYDRFEVLSGYINGLFLVVIAFFVFTEALFRLFDPPTINTERLFTVSVAGLLVNLIGIFAFRHAHSHGGGSHGHSHGGPAPKCSGAHGHSHGGGSSHGHSHSAQSHTEPVKHHNTNMEGVFLHILADTLGSVGVIISTVLIENFGLNIADPICSLFIAVMIFLSVVPLLKETVMILVLRTPTDMQTEINDGLHKILSVDGVTSIRDQHFWEHSSAVTCGTLHIMVKPEIGEQHVISQVTHILKDIGVNNLTIQVEKEAYYEHLMGLGSNVETDYSRMQTSQNFKYSNNVSALNIKAI